MAWDPKDKQKPDMKKVFTGIEKITGHPFKDTNHCLSCFSVYYMSAVLWRNGLRELFIEDNRDGIG